MRRYLGLISIILLALACGLAGSPAGAQFGRLKDRLKQKVEQKVNEKTDQKIDQTLEGAQSPDSSSKAEESKPAPTGEGENPGGGTKGEAPASATGAAGGTATSENMALYTKYDFVPGDKVIFFDDLSGEEMGEFPSRWKLDHGVFEIAQQGTRKYIMCTDKGAIAPKIPAGLPPKYTIELDFWSKGPQFKGHWIHIFWLDAEGQELGNLGIQDNETTNLRILEKDLAHKQLDAPLAAGVHTMRVMATKSTLKCYIDNVRVANVPAVEGFLPAGFRVYMDPWKDEPGNPMLLGTLRYAEGGKTLKEQLDETGRIVTHGILFDSGSTRIKAESYKTLADIGGLLTEDLTLRITIEGHTDSDGSDAANLTLSQGRADAVKAYLVETYKIEGSRLETKGWGEGKPIDTNDTAEGKANNRRVELVKL